ncbi:MAG: flagellar hook-basal body complex protein [Alphaproteobacteria bacterium]|nr:flagellar hook-basal body complex protein [Alphaproteobacteria bacterium]
MSLYGALFSGVSGLSSQASAMGAISDNVTNVNTVGYKGTKVNFQTLITKQVSLTKYSPGGVQSKPRAQIDVQGLLQSTSSATDIGMSGSGFFVVNSVADPAASSGGFFGYTRAGSFKADKQGYLQNASGFYLQGWPLIRSDGSSSAAPSTVTIEGIDYMKAYKNTTGTTHYVNSNIVNDIELKPLNLNTIGGTATATAQIKMGANLPSGDPIYNSADPTAGGRHDSSILVYDSLGNSHNATFSWTKTASNEWNLSASPPLGAATFYIQNLAAAGATPTNYFTSGQLELVGDFTSTALTGISGDTVDIDGVTFTFSNAVAYTASTSTVIGISGASSWGDVATGMKNAVNQQFDSTVAGGGRFSADTANSRLLITQYSTTAGVSAAAITVNNFTDTSNDGLNLYLQQVQASGQSPAGTMTVDTLAANNYYSQPSMVFNGNGTPNTINVNQVEVRWANGAQNMTGSTTTTGPQIDLFLGNTNQSDGMTQLAGSYQITYITQDGAKFGNFAGVSIGTDGIVTALFDNGVRKPVFQIPIATFVNPNGMESLTGNTFIETDTSGAYTLRTAKEAGSGSIASASLEASTVDLGEEFTNMIVTQRAYSASAKIITTTDQMLDELVNIKR